MNAIRKKLIPFALAGALFSSCTSSTDKESSSTEMPVLKISENGRYLVTDDGKPFFWLGDTGWLLFNKLNRNEAEQYLEDRKQKGFNVVQAMVLHTVPSVNAYGDSSIVHKDISRPLVTEGNDPEVAEEYDYWDHIDYIIDIAAEKGIYMALVPVWGSPVKAGQVSVEQTKRYSTFLAERWKNKPNIIWLNGGDINGADSTAVWLEMGKTIKSIDQKSFNDVSSTGSYCFFGLVPQRTVVGF